MLSQYSNFSALVSSTNVTLIIQKSVVPGKVKCYLVGSTTSYTVITGSFDCKGTISKDVMYFNINMDTIYQFFKLGIDLQIEIDTNKIVFKSTDTNNVIVKPLCIEYMEHNATDALKMVADFMQYLETDDVKKYDFSKYKDIAAVASASNSIVEICNNFSCVNLNSFYVLSRYGGENCVLSGKTLTALLKIKGTFYKFNNKLIFKAEDNSVFVFIKLLLPSSSINLSMLSGKRTEEYKISLKEVMPIINSMYNKLPILTLNFEKAILTMTNDSNESIEYKIPVLHSKTAALNKLMENPLDTSIKVKMSTITIPEKAVRFLRYLYGDVNVYIFKNKIILNRLDSRLYLIFGR